MRCEIGEGRPSSGRAQPCHERLCSPTEAGYPGQPVPRATVSPRLGDSDLEAFSHNPTDGVPPQSNSPPATVPERVTPAGRALTPEASPLGLASPLTGYLSTIGLVPVFSLRWSLPPALGCIPKQPDSEKTGPRRDGGRYRPHTVHGLSLDQKDSGPERHRQAVFRDATFPTPARRTGFGAGLFPLRRY
ncbi:hypothetical protein Q5P01_000867 [Channa striata]|uniref:Uncharacterized protein n=1 Tax=Channa striata TaxID=64152 RepID=A0AA88LJA4_CHASR|nr:hypothetical protein Q5P01_000867 [Channa striata]